MTLSDTQAKQESQRILGWHLTSKDSRKKNEEESPTKRVKCADRLVLPQHLAMKLGSHKGLACAWLRLAQKGNQSCTEKDIAEESEKLINQKRSESKTSAIRRADEKKVNVQKEVVVSNGEESDDYLDVTTIRRYRESKWLL